jgi:hypothetical protein
MSDVEEGASENEASDDATPVTAAQQDTTAVDASPL